MIRLIGVSTAVAMAVWVAVRVDVARYNTEMFGTRVINCNYNNYRSYDGEGDDRREDLEGWEQLCCNDSP